MPTTAKEFIWICPCYNRILTNDEDYQVDDPEIKYCYTTDGGKYMEKEDILKTVVKDLALSILGLVKMVDKNEGIRENLHPLAIVLACESIKENYQDGLKDTAKVMVEILEYRLGTSVNWFTQHP